MKIDVVPYDPAWTGQFAIIKKELEAILQDIPYDSIQHVGSTSVPGLAAKPIIDIDIVAQRENVPALIAALEKNPPYEYAGDFGVQDRHALLHPGPPKRNTYIIVAGSLALRNHLAIRDLCLSDTSVRERYGQFKAGLAEREWVNVMEYCAAKNDMLGWMLERSGLSDEEVKEIRLANELPNDAVVKPK